MTWAEAMNHNMDQLRHIAFAIGRRDARLGLLMIEASHAGLAPLLPVKDGRTVFKRSATRLEKAANTYP